MQTVELNRTSLDNSETITLQYPISADGARIEQLTLRRPLVRDRLIAEKASGNEVEKEIRLLANLCELPPQHIELLDMADYVKLQECLAGFLS
jgi:hypothetical protein